MAHNGKLVSVGTILWRVLRHPLALDLTYDQAAEFAIEFIRLIGAPLSYLDVVSEPLILSDYKVAIPNNIIDIRGVKYNATNNDSINDGIAMRYATDLYHTDPEHCSTEYTYIVQNCILTASVKDGCIKISYKAIALDEQGYPLIMDNESVRMGLEYYILHRHIEPLWSMGKIPDKVFQYYSQQRDWYIGQASSSLIIQGPDHLESVMRGLNRILIQDNAFENFYRNFGQKERLKKY